MDPELQALLDRITELNADELADLAARIAARTDELAAEGTELTDEVLAELTQLADAAEAVRTQEAALAEDADRRQAEADEQLRRIRGEQEPEGDPDPEAEPDPEADPEADADPAAEPEPEPEADPAPEAADPAAEPIAAAAPPARRAPVATRVAARRPPTMRPTPRTAGAGPELVLTAAANVPGITAGTPLRTPADVHRAFSSAFDAIRSFKGDGRVELPVVTMRTEFPQERYLGRDAVVNQERIQAVAGPQGIQAAGGICTPFPVRYDLPTIGETDMPVANDMMVNFGADRGGVRLLTPPTIEDVEGAISVWTEATDVAAATNAGLTKPCLTITCDDDETTAVVDAIVNCFSFGNFRARFFPEQIEAWQQLINVWNARFRERRLLQFIADGSTHVSAGQLLGTTRDVLTTLDRAVASIQSHHRVPSMRFRWGAPDWLRDQMRADLAREMPGSLVERLNMADQQIGEFFASRDVNVTWFFDGEPGQEFGAQGDGPLQGWPSTVVTYLYPEGSWLHLDGGELNLGLVRDSTLNARNQVQIFSETFDTAVFHGVESWRLQMDVCPDGTTSRPVDIAPCTTGS